MRPITALLVVLYLCTAQSPTASADPAKPNIVYILADDLGYGDVQCLNPERGKIKTPHLDRLASQGMTFTDAHSGSSVCTPTRYGLLTGRYAWRTRLQNGVISNYDPPLIAPDRLTVPGLLKQNGYYNAVVGKWHLGYTLAGSNARDSDKGKKEKTKEYNERGGAPLGSITNDGPLTRGFDEFFGFHHAQMMKSLFENDRVTKILEPVDMLPALVTHSCNTIAKRSRASQPFFLYVPLSSPHTPIVPAEAWQGKSGLGAYGDFVMQTDWAVGQILAAIDNAGIADNTLVFFAADNGCSTAAKIEELQAQGHFPSASFRGNKADIFEGGHRVPFLVRWPAKVKAGSESSQLICLTDLMATCAEILSVKLPENAAEDSVSVLPALLGVDTAPLRDSVVHHSINGSFAIRQGNWKLALCADSGGWSNPKPGSKLSVGLPRTQLFDLSQDKSESKNLQSERPEEVTRLTKLLEKIIADGRSTPGATQANDMVIQLRKPRNKADRE